LDGRQPQWIETGKTKMGKLLPDIIGAIVAAGPILERMKREREEQQRRYREEEARRYEARRLREIEEKRWVRFQEFSSNWDARARLLRFIAEIEARLVADGDLLVEDRLLSDWISWAKETPESASWVIEVSCDIEKGGREEPRGASYTVRWLCHRALPFPGLFLSDLYAAWALGISLDEFRAVVDSEAKTDWLSALEDAEYYGPLNEFVGRRWWRAGIDHLVYMLDSASTKQMPRKEVFATFAPEVAIKEILSANFHDCIQSWRTH
jgi:hypothetical protein